MKIINRNIEIVIANLAKQSVKLVALIFLIASCNSKTETPKEEHQDEHEAVEVTLTAEQVKAIGLQTGFITNRNLKTSLKVNGKLTLPPQNQAQVSLLVGGIVKNIIVKEGAFVNQGEALATIENTEFIQLQQDFLQSSSSLTYLKAEFERQKELQKENINATKTFQKAEADYKSQTALYNSLKQKLSLYNVDANKLTPENISSTFTVTAPISGNIHTISINIGTFAEPNKKLFDIVDNRFLHIDLAIFEKDISKIHEGQKITFTDANDPSHQHNATIFSINKAFEDNQQAVIAHAKIDDVTETLLSGMFIEARINIDNSTVLSLQTDAIVSNGNEHYIFVEHETNTYKQIPVRIGTTDQNFTEVIPLEEVLPTQKIVTQGAYYLLSELTKGEGEHDH
ncbi:MAG: efflux RND transporter periplasmic adaptor subunit [Bacteroidia bacterium]